MITGIHHISMKCGTQEEFDKAKDFYLNVSSSPALHARMAFCKGALGEEIEFFQEQG